MDEDTTDGVGRVGRVDGANGVDGVDGVDGVGRVESVVDTILRTYGTITVVGASADPAKAASAVPAHMQRHGWRIVPVNPRGGTILGETAYRTLDDIPGALGLVNVFRPSAETPDVARQAAARGATALWLQLGIFSDEARAVAEAAGMLYVEDRCILVEQRRRGWRAPAARP